MMTLLLTTLALAPAVRSVGQGTKPGQRAAAAGDDPDQPGRGRSRCWSWFTPFEGWFADAIELTLDDLPIPYKGPLAKRGNPGAEDFFLLGPVSRARPTRI